MIIKKIDIFLKSILFRIIQRSTGIPDAINVHVGNCGWKGVMCKNSWKWEILMLDT